ncbi:MAG: type II secretion system protein [Firmicutes bacterium]|nr:type II secretion system protein [Bacillota bacterium]
MKNNKGFLLAETIVTISIIATLATSMYLYVSKTTSRFEERDSYENIISLYKVNVLKEYLNTKEYVTVSSSNEIPEEILGIINDPNNLDIKKTYLISNTETAKNSLKNSLDNKTEQAFIDYLKWINLPDSSTDSRLIVWFNDNTFASLKIVK